MRFTYTLLTSALLTPPLRFAAALIATLVLITNWAAPGWARSPAFDRDRALIERSAETQRPLSRLAQSRPRRDGPDHNRARDAVRSGRALPLGEVIRGVQRYCPGRFLGAELQDSGGRLFYRVLILTDRGRRTTIMVDAGNGAVVGGRCN